MYLRILAGVYISFLSVAEIAQERRGVPQETRQTRQGRQTDSHAHTAVTNRWGNTHHRERTDWRLTYSHTDLHSNYYTLQV